MAYDELPYYSNNVGIKTQFGSWVQPGSRVFYVHNSGGRAGDTPEVQSRTYSTLNAALLQCRSGQGDVVFILEGHAENISQADQMSGLVANTRIVGLGTNTGRPAFTWTAATSTFLLDVIDVSIENCILNFDPGTGTTTVAAPITVSAAGCGIYGCTIRNGTDANSKVTIGITTSAAGDDFSFIKNKVFAGSEASQGTCFMRLVGADRAIITDNVIRCGSTASASVGTISMLTTACLDIVIARNYIHNTAVTGATSQCCISSGSTASSGFIDQNILRMQTDANTNWIVRTSAVWQEGNNWGINNDGESGKLLGTASV